MRPGAFTKFVCAVPAAREGCGRTRVSPHRDATVTARGCGPTRLAVGRRRRVDERALAQSSVVSLPTEGGRRSLRTCDDQQPCEAAMARWRRNDVEHDRAVKRLGPLLLETLKRYSTPRRPTDRRSRIPQPSRTRPAAPVIHRSVQNLYKIVHTGNHLRKSTQSLHLWKIECFL
jgi:hypothetical protein